MEEDTNVSLVVALSWRSFQRIFSSEVKHEEVLARSFVPATHNILKNNIPHLSLYKKFAPFVPFQIFSVRIPYLLKFDDYVPMCFDSGM